MRFRAVSVYCCQFNQFFSIYYCRYNSLSLTSLVLMSASHSENEEISDSGSDLSEHLHDRDKICSCCNSPLTSYDFCVNCEEYREVEVNSNGSDTAGYRWSKTVLEEYHHDYTAIRSGSCIDSRNMEAAEELIAESAARKTERATTLHHKRDRLTFRVGSHNIWRLGKNPSKKHGDRHVCRLAAAVKDAHVVLIQEISNPQGDELTDYVKAVNEYSDFAFLSTPLSTRKRSSSKQRDYFGFLVSTSQLTVISEPVFIDDKVIGNDTYSYVPAFISLAPKDEFFSTSRFNFISVHLSPNKSDAQKRLDEVKAIGAWIKKHRVHNGPVYWIVGGDFNTQDSAGAPGIETGKLCAAIGEASGLLFVSQNPGLATNLPSTKEGKQYDHFFIARPNNDDNDDDNNDVQFSFVSFATVDTSIPDEKFYANRSKTSDHIAVRSGTTTSHSQTIDISDIHTQRLLDRHLKLSDDHYDDAEDDGD
jgi:hypothetical protein